MKSAKADEAVAGLGVEISGGGLQFILREQLPQRNCAIAFEHKNRRIRADIVTVVSAPVVYEQEPWQHYRAKFVRLRETDFDFLLALTEPGCGAAQSKNAIDPLRCFDMFPASVRDKIVQTLVAMKRLAKPEHVQLALLSAQSTGLHRLDEHGASFHQLSIRSKVNTVDGPFLFDTTFSISKDGSKVFGRE